MRQHFAGSSSKLRQMPTTHLEMQINQGGEFRPKAGPSPMVMVGALSQVGKSDPGPGIIIWIRFCVW